MLGTAFIGDVAVWDDLRIPLTQSKQGALGKPDFDTTNVGLLFPQNDATEIAYFVAQMPHAWKTGSDISAHVHWRQTAATAVTWKLDYKVCPIGLAIPAAFTTISGATGSQDYLSGSIHQLTSLGDIDMSSVDGVSALILGKLYRDDNTTTGDVLGYDIDFHYQIDSLGSRQLYQK